MPRKQLVVARSSRHFDCHLAGFRAPVVPLASGVGRAGAGRCASRERANRPDHPPFILGKRNTPVNLQQGKTLLGEDYGCIGIRFWHYSAGAYEFKKYRMDLGSYVAY
jgi:hypothetical protein